MPPAVCGRSSARETIGRVAAGAVAEKYLLEQFGIEIVAWVSSVGNHDAAAIDMKTVSAASWSTRTRSAARTQRQPPT